MRQFLSLLAICKNERPEYLVEWREHYTSLGVEHAYIIEHEPNDMPIPDMDDTTIWKAESARAQTIFYARSLAQIGESSEWVAVVDCDEFIVADDLRGLLCRVPENVDALALNWLVFGSSGFDYPVMPVHGSYRWRTPEDNPINAHVKSIVRPRSINHHIPDPHYFAVRTVNERGDAVRGPFSPYSGAVARVNHYLTRSRQDWSEKIARGRADCDQPRGWNEFDDINRDCTVEDKHPCKISI